MGSGGPVRSLDEMVSSLLAQPLRGSEKRRELLERERRPLTNAQPSLTSLPRPLTQPPSSVRRRRDRTEKLVSAPHRKRAHKHRASSGR